MLGMTEEKTSERIIYLASRTSCRYYPTSVNTMLVCMTTRKLGKILVKSASSRQDHQVGMM